HEANVARALQLTGLFREHAKQVWQREGFANIGDEHVEGRLVNESCCRVLVEEEAENQNRQVQDNKEHSEEDEAHGEGGPDLSVGPQIDSKEDQRHSYVNKGHYGREPQRQAQTLIPLFSPFCFSYLGSSNSAPNLLHQRPRL